MIRKILLSSFGALLLVCSSLAIAVPIDQFESCVNVDGDIYNVGDFGCFDGGAPPGSVTDNIGADGLGSVMVTVTGTGGHNVDMYVDWELDELINGWTNEDWSQGSGSDLDIPPGASFAAEVDEPGFGEGSGYEGDIYWNFLDSLYDGNAFWNGTESSAPPEDVALGLGWDFSLADDEIATVTFLLSDVAPDDNYWLRQFDPDSGSEFFFSTKLSIRAVGVPEPGTLWLLGAGLLGLGLSRRRQQSHI